jgi:3'-5' exoribonuclease
MIRISEIEPGKKGVKFQAVISKKEKRSFSNRPGNYLELEFSDASGRVSGKKWEDIDLFNEIQPGDVAEVKGDSSEYRGQVQITVHKMVKVTDFNPADFIPSYTDEEIESSINSIKEIVETVKNPYIKKLIDVFYADKSTFDKFRQAPAAKGYHHNKVGGLAVHTFGVMRLCKNICDTYNIGGLERDMLVTGALFHDIGKISEYEYGTKIDITDTGRLLGHISIGLIYVNGLIEKIQDFPSDIADIIKHLILSHHGEYEWGSPKRPKTLAAQILHFADNLDSKIEGISMLISTGKQNGNNWSSNYDGRPFLITLPEETNNNEQELF